MRRGQLIVTGLGQEQLLLATPEDAARVHAMVHTDDIPLLIEIGRSGGTRYGRGVVAYWSAQRKIAYLSQPVIANALAEGALEQHHVAALAPLIDQYAIGNELVLFIVEPDDVTSSVIARIVPYTPPVAAA